MEWEKHEADVKNTDEGHEQWTETVGERVMKLLTDLTAS